MKSIWPFGLFLWLAVSSCSTTNEEETAPFSLEIPYYFSREYQLPAENAVTAEKVELGRFLFYEKQLSADGNISCGSCHQQGKAFTDGRALALGFQGRISPFNSMSLSNLMWVRHFFWNGRSPSLEAQALDPIENPLEMNLSLEEAVQRLQSSERYPPLFQKAFGSEEITVDRMGQAIASFERTLISANSKYDQYLLGKENLSEQEERGMHLFFTHPEPSIGLRGGNCGDCHVGVLLAGEMFELNGFHNNGLDTDQNLKPGLMAVTQLPFDKGKFRAPSLRNIELTAPYMHDGRFATLEETLEHYDEHIQLSETLDPLIREASNQPLFSGDPIKLYLSEQEKADIIAFLKTLTDYEFVNNPAFSDPF